MHLTLLKAKIHRASVTHAELHYEGSCAIDSRLLQIAGIVENEQVHIFNVNNGERFVTYAIRAEEGSGIISVNGAAAHKASPGDLVIICAYGQLDAAEAAAHKPRLVYVDRHNRLTHTNDSMPAPGGLSIPGARRMVDPARRIAVSQHTYHCSKPGLVRVLLEENMRTILLALSMALLLAACTAMPVPADKAAYVGEWRGLAMRLLITQDGSISYKRLKGGSSTSIDGPLKDFEGNDFTVGIGPIKTTFVVTSPPHQDNGVWKMTVDGVELTRMQ